MNDHCIFLVIICLVSVLLDFSSAGQFWTSIRHSNDCFWTSAVSNGHTHYMFLQQTTMGKETSFVLFDSIWDEENSLVKCITSNNHAVINSFSSKCWKTRDRPFSNIPDGRFNISMLVEPAGPCVSVGHFTDLRVPVRQIRDLEIVDHKAIDQHSGKSFQKLERSKRALLVPGTLWCGSGNKALDFSDLGLFEDTDKCCREHDHCEQTISSFKFGYGVFNANVFTLSHCDCDRKFRRCLHKVNDRMSNMVGYGYFNILKMKCFEFSMRMECAERTWWGMCKHSQMTTYALVRDATTYNSTFPEQEDDKLDLSIHHTVSFGELSFTNDMVISSDTETEDANEKHASDSVQHKPFIPVNAPEQLPDKMTESLKTHITDSPKPETTVSQSVIIYTAYPVVQGHGEPVPMSGIIGHKAGYTLDRVPTHHRAHTHSHTTGNLQTPVPRTTDSSKPETTEYTKLERTSSPKPTDSPIPETTASSKPETTHSPKPETTDSALTHIYPEIHTRQKGKMDTCESYKDLDSCPYRIPALRKKFGLRNDQHTTLYHCNCTARLARELAEEDEVDKVHFWLLNFVSQFCFNCTGRESCSASSTNDAPLIERWTKGAAVWRHLVAPRSKAMRFNSKVPKRKHSPIRLHRKCVRIHSTTQTG